MRRALPAAATALVVAALAFGATGASAAGISCTGPMGPVTINGNVSAGPGCDLSDTTVNGNVDVVPGGSLRIAFGSSTTVTGNVHSKGATTVDIEGGTFGGNIQIEGTTGTGGGSTVVAVAKVNGNVEISKSIAFLEVAGATVGGNVKIHDNTGSDPTGQFGSVGVVASTVGGNVDVNNNTLTGSQSNDLAVSDNDPGAAGSIGGNVHVHDNASVGGAAFDDVVVFTNTVGGNVRFEGNTSSGPAGAFVVNDVSGNTIDGKLDCSKNAPPATDIFGGPNAAKSKKGECAAL